MKIRKINIFLAITFGAFIALSGCKKDDGPIPSRVSIESVPVVSTNLDGGSASIDLLNLGTFSGKFKVSVYFAGATAPEKFDVSVRKNNAANPITNNNVKLFKAGITAFPTSFTVTAAEIVALFGAPIALGDIYDFGPDLYVGTKKYDAFPVAVSGTGSGPSGMPNFGEFARYQAICAYDSELYKGDFLVTRDDWADWSPGDVITLTKIDATHFSFIDPFAVNATPVPIIVTVNAGTNAASIPKTVIGTKWGWAGVGGNPNYTGAYVSTTGAASTSFVSPCDKTITLNMLYGVDPGTYSPYLLVLKKKP